MLTGFGPFKKASYVTKHCIKPLASLELIVEQDSFLGVGNSTPSFFYTRRILHQKKVVTSTPENSTPFFRFLSEKYFFFWCRILLVQNSPGVKIPTFQRILHQEISTPKPNKVFLHHFSFFLQEKKISFFGVEFSWCRNNLVFKTPFLDIKGLLHQLCIIFPRNFK